MHSQQRNTRPDKRVRRTAADARVVNLRAWKARKRWQRRRGGFRPRRVSLLAWINYLFLTVSCLLAVASCVPFTWQIPAILTTWLFATVGSAVGLVLYALHERWAMRWLSLYAVSMLVSFVAAVVRVSTM